jgi:hypothetical protein
MVQLNSFWTELAEIQCKMVTTFMRLHDNATRQKVIMRNQDGSTTELKENAF